MVADKFDEDNVDRPSSASQSYSKPSCAADSAATEIVSVKLLGLSTLFLLVIVVPSLIIREVG